MTLDNNTTPIGLFHYAYSYALSATALNNIRVKATHPDSPIRFLFWHAIELYIKSFLLLHGVTVDELSSRKFGHDLKKLVKKATQFGLQVSDAQIQQIRSGNDAIFDRYIETGFRTVLTPETLLSICTQLHKEIGQAVYNDAGIKRSLPGI